MIQSRRLFLRVLSGRYSRSRCARPQFDDGHGAEEEEQDARNLLHVVQEPVLEEHLEGATVAPVAMPVEKVVEAVHQVGRRFVITRTNTAQHRVPVIRALAALSM